MVGSHNELFVGSSSDKKIIQEFLERERAEIPQEFLHLEKLTLLLSDNNLINSDIFKEVTSTFNEYVRKTISNKFQLIEEDRYLFGYPNRDSVGGFYGRPAGGYYYLSHLGRAYLLNQEITDNKDLITLELCRNYIHDSFHSSTFRTFKLKDKYELETIPVYRHQYGFNYRLQDGVSYSGELFTRKSPLSINLNVLMDATIQIYLNVKFRDLNICKNVKPSNSIENEILKEMQGYNVKYVTFKEPRSFYEVYMYPALKFLNFWKLNDFHELILRAMITGNSYKLAQHFNKLLDREDGWELLFRQDLFKDI